MIKLPRWNITDLKPAIYDVESSTAIEMVAKLYGAMNELIEEYNLFANRLEQEFNSYRETDLNDYSCFKFKITKMVNDYIAMLDNKMNGFDSDIKNAMQYMTDKLTLAITETVTQMKANGDFDEILERTCVGLSAAVQALNENYIALKAEIEKDKSYIDLLDYCVCDGRTADTKGLQEAIDLAFSSGKKLLFPFKRDILIGDTIKLGRYCNLDFNHCNVLVGSCSSSKNYFVFLLNSEDGATQNADNPHSTTCESVIKNLNLVNVAGDDDSYMNSADYNCYKAFFVAGACKFENIRTMKFAQQVKWSNNYIDYAYVDGWACNLPLKDGSSNSNLWQFHKTGQGDNLTFKNIHFPTGQGAENENIIYLGSCYGGVIDGLINGNITLNYCQAMTIKNCHLETGSITLNYSCVTLQDNYIRKLAKAMIVIKGDNSNGDVWSAPTTLINNQFILDYHHEAYDYNNSDINIANYWGDLVLLNNNRFIYPDNSAINRRYESGIAVYNGTEALYINTPVARISNKNIVKDSIQVPFNLNHANNNGWYNIVYVANTTVFKGNIKDKKYCYALIGVYDRTRFLGTGYSTDGKVVPIYVSSDGTVDNTGVNTSNLLVPNKEFRGYDVSFILYRGENNAYDKFVEVPNAQALIDNGSSVNGFLWTTRTAGDVANYNVCYGIQRLNAINILAYLKEAPLPKVGTWTKGDYYYNLTTDKKYKYDGETWTEV